MIDPADVSAVIPTRGDVDMQPILDSLIFGEVIVHDNSKADPMGAAGSWDHGAYGRYAAIASAAGEVIYTQDDDCLVSPEMQLLLCDQWQPGELLSNMAPLHNVRMPLLALPGWGSLFPRDAPQAAWEIWRAQHPDHFIYSDDFLRIGCDIVFPVLTPSRMLDLGHENLPYAWDAHRTNLQPGYHAKKQWYYEEAARLRGKVAA